MIPKILRGDTSAGIVLDIQAGWDYTGCKLTVEYNGVRKEFSDLVAGGTKTLQYTAAETAGMPLGAAHATFSLVNPSGMVRTLPWVKIGVTDAPEEIYTRAIGVDPSQLDVTNATSADSLGAVKEKLNAILTFLRGGAAAALALAFSAHGATLNEMSGTNEIWTAAETREYVQEQMSASGSVTPQGVTNVVEGIVPAWARSATAPVTAETDPTVASWAKTNSVQPLTSETDPTAAATATGVVEALVRPWARAENPPEAMSANAVVWTNGAARTKDGTKTIGAADVGAMSSDAAVVTSVNGEQGAVTVTAAKLGAATTGEVGVIRSYLSGSTNAWLEITNEVNRSWYNGTAKYATLYENVDGEKRKVWEQKDYVNARVEGLKLKVDETNRLLSAQIRATSNAIPSTAWASYYPTGDENPTAQETWITTPTTVFSGGWEWQKTVTASRSLWTLKSNGIIADLGKSGVTNNSHLTISDWEGNEVLSVEKTASQIVESIPSGCWFDAANGYFVVRFYKTDAQPVAYCKADLETGGASFAETTKEGEAGCAATCSWTANVDNWELHATPTNAAMRSMFVTAIYERQGQTVVKNNVPVGIGNGMMVTNAASGGWIVVYPKWNGSTVTWGTTP